MNADALVSDSELVGAYASQGLIIGPPENVAKIKSPFMQQHIRGLRMVVDFALGRLAPAKPIAVISPAVQHTADVQARLEAAGYVVVVADQPHLHVAVHGAPLATRHPADCYCDDCFAERQNFGLNRGWQEGDTLSLMELDDAPLPTLDHGLYWDPIPGRSAWVVLRSPLL